jgi:guanylate kinase
MSSSPRVRRRGLMLVLSSPSGAGKTTIARQLVALDPQLDQSVSVTTRQPRPGEIDGRDYWFIDQARFDRMAKAGALLEYARVFENSYGTPRHPIDEALAAGRDIVANLDWQGARQLRTTMQADLVSVFVLPPSLAALANRLRARQQDAEAVVSARMAKSAEEISHWPEYDYVIVNDAIEDSVRETHAIITAERLRRARQTGLADFVTALRAD